MPKLQFATPRSRVIHFRVTEQEFDVICSACSLDGVQNVSEFARGAIVDLARARVDAVGNGGLQVQLDTLGQKLARVDSVLGELVSTLKPPRTVR
jgi:hypothetical protein